MKSPSPEVAKERDALLRDLRWRIDDVRDMLMSYGVGGEHLYGIDEWSTPAVNLQLAIDKIDAALASTAAKADAGNLVERLKLEAQMHAQEARTANATIAEIYQIVTGKSGEPGNWHGAEPVRKCIEELRAAIAASPKTNGGMGS
jgi:hypothetical protein